MAKQKEHPKAELPSGRVRVGIGGWIYAPWRGVFYPKDLPQSQELSFAGAKLTSIEINATFYRLQTPATFRKWAAAVPDGFVFSLKGPRLITNRGVLAESRDFMQRYFASGLSELGPRLGPLLWQFAPSKAFDEADFGKFLELLPAQRDGRKLNHVVEVRHASFRKPRFIQLLREFGVTVAFTDAAAWPSIADMTGDVVYARLQRSDDALEMAYTPAEIDVWATRAQGWAQGRAPDDLPLLAPAQSPDVKPRDVFVYFIHEGKLRAPAAAMALIERLKAA
jgi:uncharacterized protein YecE (DUF72 family)